MRVRNVCVAGVSETLSGFSRREDGYLSKENRTALSYLRQGRERL